MKTTKRQLKRIIREELEGAPVTATYYEQGYEDAVAGRDHRYKDATDAGTLYNYSQYLEGYSEALDELEIGEDWPKHSGMKRRGQDGTPRIAGKRSSAEKDHMYGRRKFKEGITKRQLKRIIREQMQQMSLPMHGAEPLAGDDFSNPSSDFWKAVRTPEAVAAFKAAGFTSDGKMANPREGLGVLEMGMYTPSSQQEVEEAIKAALEINAAILKANQALVDGKYEYSRDAWAEVVRPVQHRYSQTGAADTEGRETVGDWFDDRGWDWD